MAIIPSHHLRLLMVLPVGLIFGETLGRGSSGEGSFPIYSLSLLYLMSYLYFCQE
jgi:hypothetical protein